MLNLNSLMVGTHDVKSMAAFYEKVIGRPADMVDDTFHGWQVGNSFLSIGSHSEVKGQASEPARLIINFETADIEAEFKRIKEVGATVIKELYEVGEGMKIATFADPDGNYFQLMTPWEE